MAGIPAPRGGTRLATRSPIPANTPGHANARAGHRGCTQDLHTEFAFAARCCAPANSRRLETPPARPPQDREPPAYSAPRWRGESLAGKTLFITREQGLGDEIMFASLFGELIHAARHCVIECDPRLARLYARSFPKAAFIAVAPGTAPPDPPQSDCWAQLGDLAAYLRNDARDFPRDTGYLRADEARVAAWRERLEQRFGPGPEIGLGWRGGVARRAAERSMSLDELRAVGAGAGWVNLQYGPCAGSWRIRAAELAGTLAGRYRRHRWICRADLCARSDGDRVLVPGASGRRAGATGVGDGAIRGRMNYGRASDIWYRACESFANPGRVVETGITEVRRALRKTSTRQLASLA